MSEDKTSILIELGDSGLDHQTGYIDDEWRLDLKGSRGKQIYREMADDDFIIGAHLKLVDLILNKLSWFTEPADESDQAQEKADLLQLNMNSMLISWNDFLSDFVSCLIFGFFVVEKVYRVDEKTGLLFWDKFAPRSQTAVERWHFSDSGKAEAFDQYTYTKGRQTIPLSKCIHIRYKSPKNNPEGLSALRNAYQSYKIKKNYEFIEHIGFERNVSGTPIAYVPVEMLSPNATPEEKQVVRGIYRQVRSMKRNNKEGMVFPSDVDSEGKPTGYKFEFAKVDGAQSQAVIAEAIKRQEKGIAISLLSEFLLLGMDGGGSYSMHSDKTDIFADGIEALANKLTSAVNKQAVQEWAELNGIPPELTPKIKHSKVKEASLEVVSKFVSDMIDNGIFEPTDTLKTHMANKAGLPVDTISDEVI